MIYDGGVMDEMADNNISGMTVPDVHQPHIWRVYFLGRLTAPRFATRLDALQYMNALRGGTKHPQFCEAEAGKEIRHAPSHHRDPVRR